MMKQPSLCTRGTSARLVDRILIPLLLHAVILCMLCVVVSLPPIWNTGYRATMHSKLMSYKKGDLYMADSALISGGLWSRESYAGISSKLQGYRLNTKEQRHFQDVRSLLRVAMIVMGGVVPLLLLLRARIHWPAAWSYALLFYAAEAAIFGIWTAISWRHMFRTLHWWIFQNDSWILPKASYSLFLYPHQVWKVAGISVFAAFLLILLAGFALSRWQIRRTR